jgi:hypothetical protein
VKFVLWQIAFEPTSLFSSGISYEDRRRPNGVETVEVPWVFLDVDMKRNEIFVDVGRQTGVFIRLCFQSRASTSSRRCTEVY